MADFKKHKIIAKEKAKKEILILAHNCRFDISFIEEHFKFQGTLMRGNVFYQAEGYRKINDKTLVKLTFRDSYKMITNALRDFPRMFAIKDVIKEYMPYDLYNQENVRNRVIDLQIVKKYFLKNNVPAED